MKRIYFILVLLTICVGGTVLTGCEEDQSVKMSNTPTVQEDSSSKTMDAKPQDKAEAKSCERPKQDCGKKMACGKKNACKANKACPAKMTCGDKNACRKMKPCQADKKACKKMCSDSSASAK